MKYYIIFIYVALIATFRNVSSLIKNGSNGNVLESSKGEDKNENVCEIQKMAEEMIEKKINEKDLFTQIMDTLQSRLNDTSLCVNDTITDICIKEKDQKALSFQCTSDKYEDLIAKFTNKKLCHSKIAFNNTLLSAFIDKNETRNAFTEILNNLVIASECVDNELKDIYAETVELFKELKASVLNLSEKLYSSKMIEVLKKREEIIAGIFCELRNGSNSKIIQNGMTIENVGIIKINDSSFLNEAIQAFSEYYSYFPYFSQELLLKNGLIDKLISVHEKLTTYRAKHLVSRLNEKSKDEVMNNESLLNNLKKYKHYGSSNEVNTNFVELNEDNKTDNAQNDNTNTNMNTNTNINANTNDNNNDKKNPFFVIDDTKSKNVKEYIKELFTDLNIIKFENGDPTSYLNDENVKKEIEDSFISLESSTMLVRLFVKLQAVVLSTIQSFIIMTPSPKKDVKTYCKKTILNDKLVDYHNETNETEEEELVQNFASKYNLLYEKIKLNELKEIEELNRRNVGKKNKLSALQMNMNKDTNEPTQKVLDQNNKEDNKNMNDNNTNLKDDKTPVIAIVSDPNGKNTDDIIKENVNLSTLSTTVDDTYKNPNSSIYYKSVSTILLICFFLFNSI